MPNLKRSLVLQVPKTMWQFYFFSFWHRYNDLPAALEIAIFVKFTLIRTWLWILKSKMKASRKDRKLDPKMNEKT